MAHFAELDSNNIVLRILVVDNEKLIDENGNESEQKGVDFLKNLFGNETNWVQCSYNSNFRKIYPGIGFKYDPIADVFISPKPFESWILNEQLHGWDPPVLYPSDGNQYIWDEQTVSWVEIPTSTLPTLTPPE